MEVETGFGPQISPVLPEALLAVGNLVRSPGRITAELAWDPGKSRVSEMYEDTEVKSSGGKLHPDSPVKGTVSVKVSAELHQLEEECDRTCMVLIENRMPQDLITLFH